MASAHSACYKRHPSTRNIDRAGGPTLDEKWVFPYWQRPLSTLRDVQEESGTQTGFTDLRKHGRMVSLPDLRPNRNSKSHQILRLSLEKDSVVLARFFDRFFRLFCNLLGNQQEPENLLKSEHCVAAVPTARYHRYLSTRNTRGAIGLTRVGKSTFWVPKSPYWQRRAPLFCTFRETWN